MPDEKWGEAVKAVVSLEGDVATEADIIAFAAERLAAYKCPKTVDVVDELPRNPTGKILKKDLRKPLLGGSRPAGRLTVRNRTPLGAVGRAWRRSRSGTR